MPALKWAQGSLVGGQFVEEERRLRLAAGAERREKAEWPTL